MLKLLKHLGIYGECRKSVFLMCQITFYYPPEVSCRFWGCDIELCQKLRLTLQNARMEILHIKCVICPDTSSFHSNGHYKPISVQFFGGGIFPLHPKYLACVCVRWKCTALRTCVARLNFYARFFRYSYFKYCLFYRLKIVILYSRQKTKNQY